MADIPDVDLSKCGVTKFGDFEVEVIDPVVDYLVCVHPTSQIFILTVFELKPVYTIFEPYLQALAEEVFDFELIKSLLSF